MPAKRKRITLRLGPGGALVSDEPLPWARELDEDSARYYGGRFFIAESIGPTEARLLCEELGVAFEESNTRKEVPNE